MTQSEQYKAKNEVNRVADQVGADHARDVLRVILAGQLDNPLDVTAETVPVAVEANDSAADAAAPLGPDTDVTETLTAEGASRLAGRVKRIEDPYTVLVRWKSSDGVTVFTDTVASSTTGTVQLDELAIAPSAEVVISDESGKSRDAAYSVHMR